MNLRRSDGDISDNITMETRYLSQTSSIWYFVEAYTQQLSRVFRHVHSKFRLPADNKGKIGKPIDHGNTERVLPPLQRITRRR